MNKSALLICNIHRISDHSLSGIKKPRWKCKKCLYITSKKYLKNLKEKAVAYKGGKCKKCGYNKSNKALHFHHENPNEKEFTIGDRNPTTNSKGTKKWEAIKQELDKCILLCSNCHAEEHDDDDNNELEPLNFNRAQIHLANYHILKGNKCPQKCLEWSIEYFNKPKLNAAERKHQEWLDRK